MLYVRDLRVNKYKKEIEKKVQYEFYNEFWSIENIYLGEGEHVSPVRSKAEILQCMGFTGGNDEDSKKAIENYFDFLQWLNPNETIWVTD